MIQTIQRYSKAALLAAVGCSAFAVACGGDPNVPVGTEQVGSINARLVSESPHDVAQIFYRVVPADQDCNGTAVAERTSPLEVESLPTSLQPAGAGDQHRFSDALFTLDPGTYRVCAVPQTDIGNPSSVCAATESVAEVTPGVTTEVLLVSQCNGNQRGGLDAIVVLNDAPVVDDLSISPSKFIGTCEEATLTATVSDPDGDEIAAITWQLLTPGATLVGSGASATFTANTAGDYQVQVLVTDIYGGVGSLIVPVHVTGEDCGCQGARPNVLLCGTSDRPISEFVPPGFNLIESCTPDASTQAMFITRTGGGDFFLPTLFDGPTVRAYVEAGGIVLTEWDGSAVVFNAVFDEVVSLGTFMGSCTDNVNPLVRFNASDPFWVANGGVPLPTDEGCGFDMSAYPGITPLGGWTESTVQLAYRDAGAGRVWLIESDWQDYEPFHQNDPVMNQLMQYMVQNGGGGQCDDVPAVCTQGSDPVTMAPWVVCAADADTAWVSADNAGVYHVDQICQELGYSQASQFGGTCGNVCGYCEEPTSCEAPGNRFFDGAGECGVDEIGRQVCLTVMWECIH